MAGRRQEVAGKGVRSWRTRDAAPQPVSGTKTSSTDRFIAVYDWRVGEDRVSGDAHLAELFSLPSDEVSKGLPIAHYLRAIHPDDAGRVEKLISEAVERRESFSADYRVREGSDWKHVTALGKCYQIEPGTLRFSGVVVESEAERPSTPPIELPPRELQCLQWCSEGKTNWEIGRILGISERTVEHHIGSAVRRLGCTSRVQGVALALRVGLIK